MNREVLYTGRSMNPLMRPGDSLRVVPYAGAEIRTGDVVVFPSPRNQRQVIHRVVAVSALGISTKGDNSPHVDDWVLKPSDILGRVVAIRRQGRTLPVPREVPAALFVLKARQWCDQLVSRLLHPVYHRLAQSGLFQGRLSSWMQPRLLCFPGSQGPEYQLWLGKFLIGRKLPTWPQWSIRRPFRLFVDVASLPESNTDFQSPLSS